MKEFEISDMVINCNNMRTFCTFVYFVIMTT